jgi:Protein of unknown function (DUF2806)
MSRRLASKAATTGYTPTSASKTVIRGESSMSGPEPNTTIANVGDLAKPVTVLFERIAIATGAVFQPWQIKRVAKAEAEADTYKALAMVERDSLVRRATKRLLAEEEIKQTNIERILEKAVPLVNLSAKPELLENGWLLRFVEGAKFISDDELRSMWAAILAGEANKPGTFSKRTLDFISKLEKKEAEAFVSLCTFIWKFGEASAVLIYNPYDEIYVEKGINFHRCVNLDSIGLIRFDTLTGYKITSQPKYLEVTYFGEPIVIEFKADGSNDFATGKVLLTELGIELLSICESPKSAAFRDYCLQKWAELGLVTSSPFPRLGQ